MDISVKTDTYLNEDRSWLGSQHGTEATETVTLDVSAFTANLHFPNGFIPSGMPLGKITASGKYGPYGASPSEVQTLTVDGNAGTYKITFDGEQTAAIAFNATAAAVQAALEALSNVNPGDVVVTGGVGAAGGGTPYTLTFGGRYLGQNVPAITAQDVDLAGGGDALTVATLVAGGGAVSDGRETLVGFLFSSTAVRTDADIDVAAPLLVHGKVREANLPANHGLDAAGKADVVGRIRFI
jgi:hypothetical protein